jgi:hypothetical protein
MNLFQELLRQGAGKDSFSRVSLELILGYFWARHLSR